MNNATGIVSLCAVLLYALALLACIVIVVVRGERARKARDARLRYDSGHSMGQCSCAHCNTDGAR